MVKNMGLICFVAAVGVITGPVFFENFKRGALNYIILGIVTILIGALSCVVTIKLLGIPVALSVGLLTGALTSTPGLAAALEVTKDSMTSVGYGIAYPFGVLGVVLFVQLFPRILNTDIKGEIQDVEYMLQKVPQKEDGSIHIDKFGFFAFSIAVILGMLLGNVKIPLGHGVVFSLGTSGGPLLTGLLIGHLGRIGPISLKPLKSTMETMREFGLALFLLGAGTEAGKGFIEVLVQYGAKLFIIGAVITLLPMLVVFMVAVRLMKLKTLNALGSICGGMTSTPALGALIASAGSDTVAVAYAATYPIALIMVVLSSQFIALLC
jgi:putative transport protein